MMMMRPVAEHVMESVEHATRWLENDFSIHPRSEPRRSPQLSQMLDEATAHNVKGFCVGPDFSAGLSDFLSEALCLPPGMFVRLNKILRGGAFVGDCDCEKQLIEGFRWPVFLSLQEETPCLSFTPFSTYALLAFARVLDAVTLANFGQLVPKSLIAEIESLLQYPHKCARTVVSPQTVEGQLTRLPSAGDMLLIRAIVETWSAKNIKLLLSNYPPEAYCSKSLWMCCHKRQYKYFPIERFIFNSFLRYLSPFSHIISHSRLTLRDKAVDALMPIMSDLLLPLFRQADLLAQVMESPRGDGSAARILSLFAKTASWRDSHRLAWLYAHKANVESLPAVSVLLNSDDAEDVVLGLEIFIDLLGYKHLRKTADNESLVECLRSRFGDAFSQVFADATWALGRAIVQSDPSRQQWQEAKRLIDKFQDQCLMGESGLLLLGRALLYIIIDYIPSNVRASHAFPSLADYGNDCPRLETILRKWRYAVEYYMDANRELHGMEREFRNLKNKGGSVVADVRLLFQHERVKRAHLQNI